METTQSSVAGTSAPYGHACTNCSKAKTRCISRSAGSCERCHRLEKECVPSTVVRKRTGNKKSNSANRRAHLEEKLEDLVSLLQSQNSQKAPENSTTPTREDAVPACAEGHPWTPAGKGASKTALIPDLSQQRSTSDATGTSNPFLDRMVLTPAATSYSSPESLVPAPLDELSPTKAENILHEFRTLHTRFFPFIYIPAEITAKQFQQERPFLWLTIRAICTKSMADQNALGIRIREILARQLLVEFERSIDLLFGLVAYLAWSMYFARGKPHMFIFSKLAVSMVFDLRLDRKAREDSGASQSLSCFKAYSFPKVQVHPKELTNEDRRALLGCYYCNSVISSFMRLEAVRWAPHLEDCLVQLWEEPETPQDRVLVALARMMRVAEDATRLSWRPEDADSAVPSMIHIRALKASLEQVKGGLPPELLQNVLVLAHIHSIETIIFELAMFQQPSTSFYKSFDYKRREYLQACLVSTKAFLDLFLSIDVGDYPGLSFAVMVQFSHSVQALYRLSLLEDPGWDRSLVRQQADVVDYLEQTAVKMDLVHQVGDFASNGPEGSLFARAAIALKLTIPTWAATLEQVGAVTTPHPSGAGAEETQDPMLMDFGDDTWLTDIFASWEG
ncbi:hypothetical protein BJ170DRAFT_713751 [Xylariales sp. AK1849]|nr:hypothetical protein BJ170DRAFT_713751 [Xylariales sp. AK1849]